jgi:hypothetical protein
MSLYFNPQPRPKILGLFLGQVPVYYICLVQEPPPSADDIFGDDPNTVYVRMNVSSEKFKGD